MPPRLPGAHRVVRKLAGGRTSIYWYKTRGGEKMMQFDGASLDEALKAEHEGAQALAAAYAERPKNHEPDSQTVRSLIIRYRSAPDGLQALAASTQANWRRSLDLIEAEFGSMPLRALESRQAAKRFIEWRDRFASKPRRADYHMQVLKRVLSWSVEKYLIKESPIAGAKNIYKSSRAHLIVSPEELSSILQHVTPEASIAIQLAALTAIRREDLVSLKWEHLDGNALVFATGKSGGKKRVRVPLYGQAAKIIGDLREARERSIAEGKVPTAHILLTPKGTRWKPDSLTQAFARAAKKANVDRHLHDLRGTAITQFVAAGLSNEAIADIVGWEVSNVSNIRKHYVDPATATQMVIERLEAAAKTG